MLKLSPWIWMLNAHVQKKLYWWFFLKKQNSGSPYLLIFLLPVPYESYVLCLALYFGEWAVAMTVHCKSCCCIKGSIFLYCCVFPPLAEAFSSPGSDTTTIVLSLEWSKVIQRTSNESNFLIYSKNVLSNFFHNPIEIFVISKKKLMAFFVSLLI